MTALLKVIDESARGEEINSMMLKVADTCITIRDLIRARVTQEVEKFNLTRPVCFKCLVHPAGAEETAQGLRLPVHKDQNPSVQVDKAIEAFEDKRFFVMINGRDMIDLDATVTIEDDTRIVFMKLMPVLGE